MAADRGGTTVAQLVGGIPGSILYTAVSYTILNNPTSRDTLKVKFYVGDKYKKNTKN